MALHDYLVEETALDHADGLLTRREALRRLALLGVGATAAGALLSACASDQDPVMGGGSSTTTTAKGSSTTASSGSGKQAGGELIHYGEGEALNGSWAAPDSPKGGVVIIHENKGLTAHFQALPTRLAASGYAALAVDLLSEDGGTSAMTDEAAATAALGAAPLDRMLTNVKAALDEVAKRAPDAPLAVMGFCFGGGMTWQLLAAGEPRIKAAAPFYGPFPADADLSGSKQAAVLGVYGALDARVDATRASAEAALTKAGMVHELKVYDGADHAFFNDTGQRYNAAAAKEAYTDLLAWFDTHLKA